MTLITNMSIFFFWMSRHLLLTNFFKYEILVAVVSMKFSLSSHVIYFSLIIEFIEYDNVS